ncbi:type VII secretion protein EsaA [Listeria seeligeri]|uniref:type VII secretion protein EsaA n=1 Tax=Listeria seeligeri TaxID=1640 RepID=UPI00162A7D2B|nr:type VII secretion protein EsaA [Listeria seeligeri]MBC1731412.1 type VII secretion protein EsaA [Listeria seeligeri]MBC1809201.1 type VII secretion protein EsaA [Listeria seeligeri]MBF2452405.1 type VII secretion protein EsaA [Listeria seeligeri]MBF2668304.1 type VII secretion protein EsaA [Listeria seeligeri]MBT0175283.1 type VII secretion protein EsaA [Listeria seeligeri]
MKKVKWSILLFLVLAVVLSAGITYLALNQGANKETAEDEGTEKAHKMTIALVNEDQGATFQGEEVEFGNQFVKSIEKDDQHEWYVVSRGVAESGLKRDVYNMMIVIPSDFSEKALSMTSDAPEKVTISYKVNDVGNSDLKAEAEKTAATVLEDFNKRIIDVYFASILTTLQEAQDNVGTLVEEEKEYDETYNKDVNNPLSSYTEQFKTVQDYTGTSKESFQGFQDIMKDFEESLNVAKKENATYMTNMDDFTKMQELNVPFEETFTENLQKFDGSLSADDIRAQTAALEQANAQMTTEFQIMEDNNTLLSQTQGLQNYIADTNARINSLDDEIMTMLSDDFRTAVYDDLLRILQENEYSDQLNEIDLKDLTGEDINDGFNKRIVKEIKALPTYNTEQLAGIGPDTEMYKNIVTLSRKYYGEHRSAFGDDFSFNTKPKTLETDTVTNEAIARLQTGVSIESEEFMLPASEYKSEIFLTIDSNFTLNDVHCFVNDEERTDLVQSEEYSEGGLKLTLKDLKDGAKIKITGTAKLKEGVEISLMGAVSWNATLQQYEAPVEDSGELPIIPTDDIDEGTNPDDSDDTDEPDDVPVPDEDFDAVRKQIEPIKVVEPTYLEETDSSIKAIVDTVKDYYKLQVLFDLYYGIDANKSEQMPDFNASGVTLENSAKTSSYYYIFNKEDIIGSFVNLTTDRFVADYTKKIEAFEQRIADYKSVMAEADARSEDVTTRLAETTQEAINLNTNLALTLEDLEAWRDASNDLVEENDVVVEKSGEEGTMALELSSEFAGLLAESESLAGTSEGNLKSAEVVYKTFDAIDDEAKDIQKSGETLVAEASTLSEDLAEKLEDDETFEKNFAKVMDNSRVGDRQNENLYSFLSSPVDKMNAGTIVAGDKSMPYFMILICTILAIFTSYVISHQEKKRQQLNEFEKEMSLALKNIPITFLMICVAVIEGLVIGAVSGYMFGVGEVGMFMWIGICVLIMMALVTAFSYLLRQLNMIGMSIILLILSLYLFLTDAVGLNIDSESIFATFRTFSPLQYMEQLLNGILSMQQDYIVIVYSLIGSVLVFTALNLFVWHRSKDEENEEEHSDEI